MGDINGYSEGSVPGAMARVTVSCSICCTQSIRLRLSLDSGYNVRETTRLYFRITVRQAQRPWLRWSVKPPATTTVEVMCLVKCMGRIKLWLELGSSTDVRAMARLSFRIIVRHG